MLLKLFLAVTIATATACSSPSSRETGQVPHDPPKPGAEGGSHLASNPEPVRVSMAGELNTMPSLAALGDRVVLVWAGTKDGVMSVYSAVSNDRGATFNIQRRVNDQPGDVSSNVEQPPRVAISSAGISVIWSSKKSGTAAIRLARSTDGGKTFSPATTIHSASLSGARGWESIASAADGSVHVVWLDGRNAQKPADTASHEHHTGDMAARGGTMDHSKMAGMAARPPVRQDVFGATIDPSGKVNEAPVASNVCFCCKTAVAVGSRGQVFAAWRHIFPGSLRDIAMAVSTDGGRTFGPLARVSEDKWQIAGCPEDGPAMALDSSDAIHIVWPTVVSEGQPQKAVFYSTTMDGRTFSPRVRLSGVEQDEAAHPQIAVRADGAVTVVWDEPHGDGRQVLMRTATAGSGQFGPATSLSSTQSANHPVVVPLADGLLAGWASTEGAVSAIVLQRVGVSPAATKPVQNTEYSFRGKVESVDVRSGALTVNGEDVEGWMGAMTMSYQADDKDIVNRVKAGDRITATVRTGDFQHLYGVRVVR